ncbi:fumarylacetoacetate hydrolase family protein [Parasphingopyxis sp.]|uniref:fumarylacetoacetate hydrolase family protein n=1 Tax=Parasphingopyxis sp. TaxID=1920299 RepID=UPI00261B964F|nr:fumarylacetoacetate hydrolase family protein [Parasphingopyxis sp.]
MARRIAITIFAIVALGAIILFALWATSPDPRGNAATFEDSELESAIRPLDEAVTLARMERPGGDIATLLVLDFDGNAATVVDLETLGAVPSDDPFEALASVDGDDLASRVTGDIVRETVSMDDLLPAAGSGDRHIATGTNFPEHAEEASSDSVFRFPKFGTATPARTTVTAEPDVMLDYEIEMCMIFDRPIRALEDFDAAAKGFFLCGDFTDRSTLIRLIDPDNLDSGHGFSDAKSGPGFYPAGAFLVIPRDWRAFIAEERMTTHVNDERRQDARGGEMTLDFRELTEQALADMAEPRFLYQDDYYHLSPEPEIREGMTLMSGTSEGVIFTPPTRADIIEGGLWHLFSGRLFEGETLTSSVIEVFIGNELETGHFLQPGDIVHYRSSSMGDIVIAVE